jgi:long-chain acyl-CoA synthetase
MATELEKNMAQRFTAGDIFRRNARHAAEKIALVEKRGATEFRLNYRELDLNLNRFAAALRSRGLKKGDKVGILAMNSHEFMITVFGCARGGFVAVPMNPGMSPDDIVYMINHSNSTVLVTDDIFSPLLMAINDEISRVTNIISIPISGDKTPEGLTGFHDLLLAQPENEIEEIIWERDTFGIYYTSGTTSRPKGTVLSHLTMVMAAMTNAIDMEIKKGMVAAMVLPAFHAAQHGVNMAVLMTEGKLVICRTFDPSVLPADIEREKIEHILLLPAMWRALVNYPGLTGYDLSSLKHGLYGMAPMDKPTLKKLITTFTENFTLGTGQTEFFPSSENFKKEWQLTKTGNYWGEPAITVETAIMDHDGNILPPGEIGEIVRRGPGALTEYLNNPEATDDKMKYGWAHSEDLGYFDEDGLLVFVDRKKDMIKTGGENVPSIKVEQVVLGHPKVGEAAVLGIPHPHWNEAITAFVVPVPGVEVTEEEIRHFCKEHLGGFEVPKKIILINELPLTGTGKVQKNVIKEEYQSLYDD